MRIGLPGPELTVEASRSGQRTAGSPDRVRNVLGISRGYTACLVWVSGWGPPAVTRWVSLPQGDEVRGTGCGGGALPGVPGMGWNLRVCVSVCVCLCEGGVGTRDPETELPLASEWRHSHLSGWTRTVFSLANQVQQVPIGLCILILLSLG